MDLFKKKELGADEIEAIFKYIPSLQLLQFRTVSKEWDAVAQLVLRKRRDIKLFLTTNNCDGKTNWEFLQFLNHYPETFVAPIMHMKNTNTSDQDLPEGGICTTFEISKNICRILGNRENSKGIRHLIIEDGDKTPHFNFEFLLAALSNLSSSLETLEIYKLMYPQDYLTKALEFQLPLLKEIIFGDDFEGENYLHFLKMILTLSPKLTNISEGFEVLDLIPMLRETGRLPKMRTIALRKPEDWDILLELQPKIALQKLSIVSEELDPEKLKKFLQGQLGLKELDFSHLLELEPYRGVILPFLPLLEKLTFCPRLTDDSIFKLINGRNLPKLRSLCLNSDDFYHKSWEVAFSYAEGVDALPMPPCPLLYKLELNMLLKYMTPEERQKLLDGLKNIFPNLKILHLNVDSEEIVFPEFKLISKCWPNLVDIKIHFEPTDEVDLDEVLFGISAEWKRSIDTTIDQWWGNVTIPGGIVTNLKNLRRLEILAFLNDEKLPIFTDFSVYCCFKHLTSLQKLTVWFPGKSFPQVSDVAADFPSKNLPNLETFGIATGNDKKWTWFQRKP